MSFCHLSALHWKSSFKATRSQCHKLIFSYSIIIFKIFYRLFFCVQNPWNLLIELSSLSFCAKVLKISLLNPKIASPFAFKNVSLCWRSDALKTTSNVLCCCCYFVYCFFHIILIIKLALYLFNFREKKKEKERDELWKKLSQLELNHKAKLNSASHHSP